MTKGDLINKVAEGASLSKADASKAVSVVLSTIQETLQDGDKVSLIGFGTFSTSMRNERIGRNPKTGESITIPAKNMVKFKAGSELSNAVN